MCLRDMKVLAALCKTPLSGGGHRNDNLRDWMEKLWYIHVQRFAWHGDKLSSRGLTMRHFTELAPLPQLPKGLK